MRILFAAAAAEAFAELPETTKRRAANSIELLEQRPKCIQCVDADYCVATGILSPVSTCSTTA